MANNKNRTFNAGAIVREIARERIGQPKPTAVLVDKRQAKRRRETIRELREAVCGFRSVREVALAA
jgi:hypothetical protein